MDKQEQLSAEFAESFRESVGKVAATISTEEESFRKPLDTIALLCLGCLAESSTMDCFSKYQHSNLLRIKEQDFAMSCVN